MRMWIRFFSVVGIGTDMERKRIGDGFYSRVTCAYVENYMLVKNLFSTEQE